MYYDEDGVLVVECPSVTIVSRGSDLRQLEVTCDRCKGSVSVDDSAYHCLQCKNFDICTDCASEGLYCKNDTHTWKEYQIKLNNATRVYIGPTLSTSGGRILQPGSKPYPTLYQPSYQNDTPESVFLKRDRFISSRNPREILIYTDGACSNNGQSNPKAGCAFVYRQSLYNAEGELASGGTVSFALEEKGPSGAIIKHTSNRAELRAVIAALQFMDWSKDCNRSWRSVVIATDSEYVAVNATSRIQRWEGNDWGLDDGSAVKNVDLWILLLERIRLLQRRGVHVSFWRIPREWNARADQFAKEGATWKPEENFHKTIADGPVRIKSIPI